MKIELSSYNAESQTESKNKLIFSENTKKESIEQALIINKLNEKNIIISPEEQFKNYSNYKFFKIFGILFCKIGKTYVCNFDKKNNNSPKICIGPHWYLAIITNILITLLIASMYFSLIDSHIFFYKKVIYFILSLFVYFFFNRCALINPGIIQNNKMDNNNVVYCNICQVYYAPDQNVEHCKLCQVCVEKMDHHCVWVGKCVGKNNAFSFYAMLVSIGIVYGYIIYLAFFQYSIKSHKIE